VKKIGKNNRRAENIGWIINQMLPLGQNMIKF
jgi:hypothetical protein